MATVMDHCVLIVFNSTVKTYPADGTLLSLAEPDSRERLRKFLDGVQPIDGTNTRAAMMKAYEYKNLDTIILFTDGAPNNGHTTVYQPEEATKIFDLCKQHPGVQVNTIGVGNYFDADMSKFLLELSKRTGGTFLGR
jgi:hypothetical protein